MNCLTQVSDYASIIYQVASFEQVYSQPSSIADCMKETELL
jgi:hypothetical protein